MKDTWWPVLSLILTTKFMSKALEKIINFSHVRVTGKQKILILFALIGTALTLNV